MTDTIAGLISRPNIPSTAHGPRPSADPNKLDAADKPAHDWYRFVLSFPPHIVRQYLTEFGLGHDSRVLDPFCGTGTTLVEAKKLGIPSIGFETSPIAAFASAVKVDWTPNPKDVRAFIRRIASLVSREFARSNPHSILSFGLRSLPPEAFDLLLSDSIDPVPLHRVLCLLHYIEEEPNQQLKDLGRLALAKTAVATASNLKFGPEVGVSGHKQDAPVLEAWTENVQAMADDLEVLADRAHVPANVMPVDSRHCVDALPSESIDAVFTSPPYPNEKDYSRTTRLETVLLGFINNKKDLQIIKRLLLRSNTRNVYRGDDDDQYVTAYPRISHIAECIERRRIELNKTSGFERLYSRVTKLYFGGMARHLAGLRSVLRPGARLAYVVGDQASFLRVHIPTGELLGEIAQDLGYEQLRVDLFRTRLATATKTQLREEVLLLRWPGQRGGAQHHGA